MYEQLAIPSVNDFVFGRAPKPVKCRTGLEIGAGRVVPEINFTLPAIETNDANWTEIRRQYTEMIESICERAVALEVPELLVEFETLPTMTVRAEWALDITRILAGTLGKYRERGLVSALRLTPNDNRDMERPAAMRTSKYWDGMKKTFAGAAEAGADMLAIESTGGKEICDEALLGADLRALVFALGVLAPRDMKLLWTEIVGACKATGIVPSGDTACGFANTAMVLAEQKFIPRVYAAVVRVASVARGLVAYECGAVGPSKDCAYEGPYMKAIAGVPISMEGRTAACAHLSSVGNVAQAVCDCWSNESVLNVRLLSAFAPTVSLEQLAYDCRLMDVATERGEALKLRDWLTESDAPRNPQGWVLKPDVVLKLSGEIIKETDPYRRTRAAVLAALREIEAAHASGALKLPENELPWLDMLKDQAATLPEREGEFIDAMLGELKSAPYLPSEYGL
jgi:methanol--5-hydroxybenzimidazolylcobamide Co-methyltransferase